VRPTNVLKGYSLDNGDPQTSEISPAELRDGFQLKNTTSQPKPSREKTSSVQELHRQPEARRKQQLQKEPEHSNKLLRGAQTANAKDSREEDGVNSLEEDLLAAIALSKRKDALLADVGHAEEGPPGASGTDEVSHVSILTSRMHF
jgi:hypothetical protein